ncbi:glycerophosphodiester phosphodiesterase [Rhodospirillum centenum]|uniref:glycerophosphodiester phosphodiesterase n=1 Tax=Rhodospirillum centenum (strain ATCC 51521 / SW) TaxID=414684 RepID=B6IQK2_RHOCS|nr:glycerophosphodiester phosphodiesterase [Rhodospirillum centenum]ACI97738.1 glycerophosphoryl diester phosphodiesterase [Rhodospirillum centenum SW]
MMGVRRAGLAVLALAATLGSAVPGTDGRAAEPGNAETAARPVLVIAHRGASGERPEHTLMAYERAIDQGADFIEPDLVATRDGVLVARHENEISGTTDVADRPEFAGRRTTKRIDGAEVSGWFTEDFTLAELKTLRARERLPQLRPGNTAFDGQETVPTLAEVIALVRRKEAETGRRIGLYPETKHPGHFRALGLALEPRLVEALHAAGYRGRTAPVFIQSFEVGNLKELRGMTDLPLVQLVAADGAPADLAAAGDSRSYADLLTETGLTEIARYADGIGAEKVLVIPRDAEARSLPATDLVRRAHAAGLAVHVWTLRSENYFLPAELRRGDSSDPRFPALKGDAGAEAAAFAAAGVDGVFADFPADALAALRPARK